MSHAASDTEVVSDGKLVIKKFSKAMANLSDTVARAVPREVARSGVRSQASVVPSLGANDEDMLALRAHI